MHNNEALSSYPELENCLKDPLVSNNKKISVATVLHPRNRKEKYAVTEQLLDADVVISDFSSVVYEAWALGKPVIFPRWLLGDKVLSKAPHSAEAYIYRESIGYHPDSFEAFLRLLESEDLCIDDQVFSFIHDYIYDAKNYDSGVSISKNIRKVSDENYLSVQAKLYKKLQCAMDEQRWGEAKQALQDSIQNEANDANELEEHFNAKWRYMLRAEYRSAAQAKSWRAAEEVLSELISYDAQNPENYNLLSQAYRKQGKWDNEIKALEKSLTIDSHQPTSWYRLGEAYEVMSNFNSASDAYQKAVNLKNSLAEWYFRLGSTLQRGDVNLHRANDAYETAIKLDNQHNSKVLGIGVFHEQCGHWEEARKAFEHHLNSDPINAELLYRTAMACDRSGDWPAAERYYIGALSIDPGQPYWHFRLGLAYEYQGKYSDAALAYQSAALQRGAHTPFWYYTSGSAYQKIGKYKEAAESYLSIYENGTITANGQLASEYPSDTKVTSSTSQKTLLSNYLERFNSHNFTIEQLGDHELTAHRPDWL
ncbi:tetratricopeptide repeat protein, partial [Halomonas sp. BC2]|uniref:tetratricopeptide repeat protein n=1 Tax=Halomonas sp. BC2 TaxID=1670449 RepID=UPI001482D54D